ncbi:MAG: Cof-type HAD-IIB family hydrolase [Spirochaetaceae bacterium]|jgi:Cof subfamily protein (haloacid dehalogenase superfamily)|nr:Cof-type HAD-IIB family hydrolase [Spirochaetaceae bacterium]
MKTIETDIIALDLDDTLLKSDLSISDYTVETLRKAAEQGIYIVIASGRADNAILPSVRRLELAGTEQGRYIIGQNGTSITDLHTRQPVYTRVLPGDIAVRAYEIASENTIPSHIYDGDIIYTSMHNRWSAIDAELSGLRLELVEDYPSFIAARAALSSREGPSKGVSKVVLTGDPDRIQHIQRELKEEFRERATVFTSKPFFLEIMPPGAGKGEALAFLAEKLHIPKERVMAFGDSMNDESMIRYAGSGVAMKNGLPYIQSIARYVTEQTHDEDGIACFIRQHCLD